MLYLMVFCIGMLVGGIVVQIIIERSMAEEISDKIVEQAQEILKDMIDDDSWVDEKVIKNATVIISRSQEHPENIDIGWMYQDNSEEISIEEYEQTVS